MCSETQVDEHQVVVRAAGDEVEAALPSSASASTCAFFDYLFLIGLEFRLQRLAEAYGLGGDDVHERTALRAGEDGLVDCLCELFARTRIMPPRGPRRVLWVVVVTMSA